MTGVHDQAVDEKDGRVGKRAKSIIIFLTSCIPKRQLYSFTVNFDIGDIVLEDGWNINLKNDVMESKVSGRHQRTDRRIK